MIGIIFDCDGVLVDSENSHFLSWQKALEKYGISWDKNSHFSFCGYPGISIAQKFCQRFNINSPETLLEEKRSFFKEFQSQGFAPMPYTINLLRQLSEKKNLLDIKLGVASGARKKEILLNLKQHDLTAMFDVIVSGYDDLAEYSDLEGTNKPKPYIFLHTAKLLGLDPFQCIVIEDSGPGVLAANRAGMITFAIPNEFSCNHDFSPATYCLFPNAEIDFESFYQKIKSAMEMRNKERLDV